MKWRELLGFFGCFAFGFACTQGAGGVATGTLARLCSSNDDCAAVESCDLQMGTGVCKPLATGAAAGSGSAPEGSPATCSSDAQCGYGRECEYEHGVGYCKPHHDDPEADGGKADCADDSAYGEHCEDHHDRPYDAGAPTYPPCSSDADCMAYQTCSYGDGDRGDDHGGGSGSGHGDHGDGKGDGSGSGHGDDHGGGDGDGYYGQPTPPPPSTGVCKPSSKRDDYGR